MVVRLGGGIKWSFGQEAKMFVLNWIAANNTAFSM